MKKKAIKNRKVEFRNKRLLFGAIFLSIVFVTGSIIFVLLRFIVLQKYVSPIPLTIRQDVVKKNSLSDTFISEVKEKLTQASISYNQIKLTNSFTCIITLSDGSEVILGTNKDIAQQIASLQLITSRLTMEGKRFSRIDLRYNQPVFSE